ncbi:hypothetical protein [Pleionea sp. CnH1-48]|uniref:hypothetical protein n=1 Tax=Pleionea sp. CnH1-48 TaxID=2954494 RepID=UPI0020970140|nr:hypothetical protein [Pleionea sp. CnH1-48]MCO7223433.1 hypothetical protein [Pleionea sp. CnH1-48]
MNHYKYSKFEEVKQKVSGVTYITCYHTSLDWEIKHQLPDATGCVLIELAMTSSQNIRLINKTCFDTLSKDIEVVEMTVLWCLTITGILFLF